MWWVHEIGLAAVLANTALIVFNARLIARNWSLQRDLTASLRALEQARAGPPDVPYSPGMTLLPGQCAWAEFEWTPDGLRQVPPSRRSARDQ